ncbi:23S rRNA (uracil(1939)-C(5))-methyltransferase RlmD [Salisediminibacterium halotolerans]|uniref:tRNA (Uracil-5-)-methyltransferase/23S rRNA (Uracil1939-C5)-methyltransferase n=1 Tax=Salisediminibacterium halotolerans TaxID=517425 RepID=A0A1H9UFB7_9BACI|nr:23S rRNA (uracil(1939)-C(5))-methyltransferase RlmD [Salisediminibacterium haloalkalitolerans]SES08062.1 tRNA (uracil-5-)-methyltransferase/23S rRNA (uracil1939-C5)-methyltransferase [Salisediminibacterium haloalkalitolerans]
MANKPKQTNVHMKIGQQFPLTIKRLGINGEGVGFFKRQVVFVPEALPGEEVVAEVAKISGSFVEAKVLKMRKTSKERVTPPCPVYDKCGGCQLQHLSYAAQLAEKQDLVRQAFERYTSVNLNDVSLHETIGMESPWYYRNKSQMQTGVQNNRVAAGLYGKDSHKLIDIPECIVQHPAANEITAKMKRILEDLSIPIYNERKRKGAVRTIVVRAGFATDERQLTLVSAVDPLPREEAVIEEVKKRIPEVDSLILNVNAKRTSTVYGDKTRVLAGREKIAEKLDESVFYLSSPAFFQLNPPQTERLYETVREMAEIDGDTKVVDAYCGVGTIAITAAKHAKEVRGMDTVAEAIADARSNAEANGVDNAYFETGKAEACLPKWIKDGWRPDVVIVDPPRSGLDESLIRTLIESEPDQLIYVSCNPSTLAKNTKALEDGGFTLLEVQPVDMFPMTAQIESVARFSWEK